MSGQLTLPSNWKCVNCGFVNENTDKSCKECKFGKYSKGIPIVCINKVTHGSKKR